MMLVMMLCGCVCDDVCGDDFCAAVSDDVCDDVVCDHDVCDDFFLKINRNSSSLELCSLFSESSTRKT